MHVVLEKTLESPLDCKESNQSILKEISPEHSLEGLMVKLKLQYSGHLMGRTDSLEKTLMLGKIEGWRRRGRQRMRWMASPTRWAWVYVGSGSWWWAGRPGVLQSTQLQRAGLNWATEPNWMCVRTSVFKHCGRDCKRLIDHLLPSPFCPATSTKPRKVKCR